MANKRPSKNQIFTNDLLDEMMKDVMWITEQGGTPPEIKIPKRPSRLTPRYVNELKEQRNIIKDEVNKIKQQQKTQVLNQRKQQGQQADTEYYSKVSRNQKPIPNLVDMTINYVEEMIEQAYGQRGAAIVGRFVDELLTRYGRVKGGAMLYNGIVHGTPFVTSMLWGSDTQEAVQWVDNITTYLQDKYDYEDLRDIAKSAFDYMHIDNDEGYLIQE